MDIYHTPKILHIPSLIEYEYHGFLPFEDLAGDVEIYLSKGPFINAAIIRPKCCKANIISLDESYPVCQFVAIEDSDD